MILPIAIEPKTLWEVCIHSLILEICRLSHCETYLVYKDMHRSGAEAPDPIFSPGHCCRVTYSHATVSRGGGGVPGKGENCLSVFSSVSSSTRLRVLDWSILDCFPWLFIQTCRIQRRRIIMTRPTLQFITGYLKKQTVGFFYLWVCGRRLNPNA